MKTYLAIIASLLLAAGSTAAFAGNTNFSDADQNGDGYVDRQEASNAGIPDDKFQKLDSNGDGVLSQSEYREHGSDKAGEGGY